MSGNNAGPTNTSTSHGGNGKRNRRAAILAGSKLTDPQTPVYQLASDFQRYMHMPDPSLLYITMGTMASAMLQGKPVWTMLIGKSGGGKTKMLLSLKKLDRFVPVGSMKGEAGFLSGTSKKERAKDATGGVLGKLGPNGCIGYMDFTTLLSKGHLVIEEVLGALRELYDMTYQREVGSDGGRTIEHTGRVNLIGGVTPKIDRVQEVSSDMGQRTLFFRLNETSGYQESLSAIRSKDPQRDQEDMQQLVYGMFWSLGLSMLAVQPVRDLGMGEEDKLVSLAIIGGMLRGSVPRNWRTREVEDLASTEVATRMSQQLKQLYLGMEIIGVDSEDRWRVIEKVVLDGTPQLRRKVMDTMVSHGELNNGMRITTAAVAKTVKVSETTTSRTLEDLAILGVTERHKIVSAPGSDNARNNGVGKVETWRLTEWAQERFKRSGIVLV